MASVELRIVAGPNAGQVITVGAQALIGRVEWADVVLADPQVSGQHARLTVRRGQAIIEDLGSSNGTFVNEKRVKAPRLLHASDEIRVGKTRLALIAAPAARQPPRPPQPEAPQAPPRPVAREERPAREAPPRPRPDRGTTAPAGQLVVLEGPGVGQSLTVARAAVLGRDPYCDLVIPDGEVSRQHLRIGVDDGHAVAVDIGSTNGTFLNGERLIGRRDLNTGDRLDLGHAVLQFTGVGQVAQPLVSVPRPTSIREIVAAPVSAIREEATTRKWWTLLVVCTAVFMLLIDTTIVAVALPDITTGLNASFTSLQWVVDAYALLLAVALLTAGSISDIVGRRRVFATGIVIFTCFSAACGLSTSATELDIFRGFQGVGGALMLATSLALLAQEFPPQQRGVAFGAWGATTGVAAAVGPLVGGALTQAFGWPAIFYVNVPVGIAALLITQIKLVNVPGPDTKIDWLGLVTFTGSMFLLLFGVIRGNEEGWTSPLIIGSFVGSVLLGATFVWVEQRSDSPMLPLTLLRNKTLDGAAVAAFCTAAAITGLVMYIVLWLQSILGYNAFEAGIRLLPMTILALMLSPLVGRISGKVPPAVLMTIGFTVLTGGLLLMSRVNATSGWTVLLFGLVLAGLGLGNLNTPLASTAVGVVPPWQSGVGAGVNTTFRQLGLSTGVAALGAVLQTVVHSKVTTALAGTPLASRTTDAANAIASGGTQQLLAKVPAADRTTLNQVAHQAFAAGLSRAFTIAAVIAVIGAIASVLVVRRKDFFEMPPGGGGPPGGGPPGGGPPGGGPPGGGPPGGGPPGGGPPGGGPPGGYGPPQ